jgi:two-component sensor histidine kinase
LANEILARELQHRNRNVFTVIEVIVQKTLADYPNSANEVLGRIRSIMRANELLTGAKPQLLTLKNLLLQEFEAYGEDRLVASGPEVYIEPDSARHLILLLHELATNAAKHGSLSQSNGRVLVDWQQDGNVITLHWKEKGGPNIAPPSEQGFGSELIAVCVKSLSGAIQTAYSSDGFACSVDFNLRK